MGPNEQSMALARHLMDEFGAFGEKGFTVIELAYSIQAKLEELTSE